MIKTSITALALAISLYASIAIGGPCRDGKEHDWGPWGGWVLFSKNSDGTKCNWTRAHHCLVCGTTHLGSTTNDCSSTPGC